MLTGRMLLACLVSVLSTVTGLLAEELPKVVAAEGEPFPAGLVAVDKDWRFTFAADGPARQIGGQDLVRWGAASDPVAGMLVILSDGGLLVTNSVQLEGETIRGVSEMFGKWQLPLESAAGVVLRVPGDRTALDKLIDRIAGASGRGDRLWLDNGDQLNGTLAGLDATKAVLDGDGGPVEVKLDSVAALVFDPSLTDRRKPVGLQAIVGVRDGSRLVANELVTSGDDAHIKLAVGGELTTAKAWLTLVQMSGGRALYLSQLEPASFRHLPFLNLEWPYRKDRNVTGQWLRAGGHAYLRGLGMHSPARITYDLDQAYQRFEAEVAVDESVGNRGSVLFRVFVDDGSGEWQQRAASPVQRGGDAPYRLSADVTDAKRISLLVDFADRGDELDHADWLDARLIRDTPAE